ncbi:PREDICTED: uncharacterized protein LOC104822469 [Tarenaya hassleriana]|uniref:uncharacterized protein LOC104822469 n=1 Tax=Tarenaya hassleriana TaxID=28532 RepID=UPI00053C3585|nr:PREDICTED: uncharacterized protein LOC104822469 [Tarenaya hassleriana]
MVRRNAAPISYLPMSSELPARRWRRRRAKRTVRLGNRRRGFWVGPPRTVVLRWRINIGKPMRVLRNLLLGIISARNVHLSENYCWSLPILRPQLFPFC